ncbi:hypothetical protein MNBD_GAMMA10-1 [hydrothermal vent metagenome]|uniref:Uncharacterized protein n=1 Tax=hydrothermal vent metagenome TaxID=652676 RepID=A0A3B0Y5M0_9ZZZZ
MINREKLTKSYMKLRILTTGLSLLVITSFLMAQPEQRIIIQFKQVLTQEDTKKIDRHLKNLLKNNYKVADHSSENRWILIIPSPLPADVITNVIKNINTDSRVQFAESDQLLRIQQQF